MLWAETAETHDAFEAFVALAEVWRRIADLEHQASAQGDAFLAVPKHPAIVEYTSRPSHG